MVDGMIEYVGYAIIVLAGVMFYRVMRVPPYKNYYLQDWIDLNEGKQNAKNR